MNISKENQIESNTPCIKNTIKKKKNKQTNKKKIVSNPSDVLSQTCSAVSWSINTYLISLIKPWVTDLWKLKFGI